MAAIIIEDGSGVPNANSYVTVTELREFAVLQGKTLPASDDAVIPMLVNSAMYLDTFECKFPGKRSFPLEQSFCWPRSGVVYFDVAYPANKIQPKLKTAQMFAALFVADGGELFPSQSGADIKREKVGPLETEYAVGQWTTSRPPVISSVTLALALLFSDCGSCAPILRTRRV